MASALESRQPQAALAGYRELAQKGGAWAQNALFAEGRLEADLGERDEARRLLSAYLARYPGGPNADDARQLLERMR
jgi:TolA-binding protein